jgi:ATP-binding cassette subfamily F protein uup
VPLATLDAAELAFGHVPLLDRADFAIDGGERVALIGRNGAGKSTLLGVLAGTRALDDGAVWRKPGLIVASVAQEPDLAPGDTVRAAIARGLAHQNAALAEYEALLGRDEHDDASLAAMARAEARMTESGAWDMARRVESVIERLGLPAETLIAECSGGMKKRVALGQAIAAAPELLLLDEPTNHLDIDGIQWLETLLIGFPGAVLFITHDRAFLDRVATRVVELDRGRLLSYPGNYASYQARKAEQLEVERVVNAKFDKFLAAEEVWIRKGIEARRTRNEGRVRRLERLRRERADRNDRMGRVSLAVDDARRSGKLVAELEHVGKSFGTQTIVRDLSITIMRGDKLGIVGRNGAGKSTLIRMMLGELAPDTGSVRLGTRLDIAYFDQFRTALDEGATLVDTIAPGSEWVEIGGVRRHVMTYLGDFLFPPERAQAKVASLSGGERNRLLLARLFAQPANLLVLDEPTNDLDIDTLELLESLLQEFSGTVILVSHDRAFLDAVATQVLVAEGDGVWTENPGGYSEWQAVLGRRAALAAPAPAVAPAAAPSPAADDGRRRAQKLSFKEVRELEGLPGRIEALEIEQRSIQARLADSELYVSAPREVAPLVARNEAIEAELIEALERWEILEAKRGAAGAV